MKELPRLVITGSCGLIGKKLVQHFKSTFSVLELDLTLGHDLTDEIFVRNWFQSNTKLYGIIIGHAYNPVPLNHAQKIEPVDVTLNEIRKYMEINTVSAFNVCRQFIKNNTGGCVINISSIYGSCSPRHNIYTRFVKPIGYSMSKGALNIMTKYLATYYAPAFRINTVIFGGVHDPNQDTGFVQQYAVNTPMKRMMQLDEVCSVFDFLLDPKSSYVTGSEIVVDGGWTAW